MVRQLLASLVVLAGAFLAWAVFVPGAQQTLLAYGIALPFIAAETETNVAGATPQRGGAGGFGARGGRATNVVTTPVSMAIVNDDLTAVGEGSAVRSATVTAPAGGTLQELLVRPGQTIAVGDIIGRLDAESEQIAYDMALLAAEDARATLARQEELANSNLVAASALDAAQLAAQNAELDLRSAEIALDRRSILAPIAGTIGLIQVTTGNYLAAQTAVTTIDDISEINIDFWVPERFVGAIAIGTPVTVSAIALPGRTFEGEVSAVDSRIDTTSRTLQVQASIPNEAGGMRSGMSFSVAVEFEGDQYPTVDPLSILWSAEGSYVWKYEDGQATRVMAEIVQRNSDGVLVRGDLAPGDAIITEGLLQLTDGATVTLLEGPDGTGTVEAAAAAAPTDDPET